MATIGGKPRSPEQEVGFTETKSMQCKGPDSPQRLPISCLVAILFILFMWAPVRLPAQSDTAQIQGSALDASGAVVPGAKITLTDKDTAAVYTATSDASG
ncbi:MAG TPA: carboxypeptidase-like regulatory domain-containing protein, partial [Edaphobacter sp.]|nr:carboxypeptidase-like regulatory domain-containing protein [Edaphobacter sp.]